MKKEETPRSCHMENECLKQEISKRKSLKNSIRLLVGGVLLATVITFSALNVYLGMRVLDFLTGSAMVFLAGAGSVAVDGDYLNRAQSDEQSIADISRSITEKVDKIVPDSSHHDIPVDLGNLLELTLVKNVSNRWVYIYDSKKRSGEFNSAHAERWEEVSGTLREVSTLKGFSIRIKYISGRIIAFSPVLDGNNRVSGVFMASIDRNIILYFRPFLIAGVAVIGIVVFIVFALLSKAITVRLMRPLEALDGKIRELASAGEDRCGDFINCDSSFQEVKRLADATNMLVSRHHQFIGRLSDQKLELYSQNQMLEAQQQELLATLEELRETQTQLVQSEKMASLGQLTAGIAHEINTPLGAINSNTDMIDMFLKGLEDVEDPGAKTSDLLKKIKRSNETNILAIKRIMEIVRTLKNFSRLDEADFQEADLHQGIESVLLLAQHHLKHNITVNREYGELPRIECYPNQLNQVFMNLVVNAAQSIEGKGEISIRTGTRGDNVFVEIEDTGNGIPPENINRVFDPGFTTKGVGVGTGLGLSICYNIIKKHRGIIQVESHEGKGSLFRLLLPVRQTPEKTLY